MVTWNLVCRRAAAKIARRKVQLLLYYSHFEMTDLLKVESETLSNLILYGKKMIRFRAKVMRFRTEMMRYNMNDAI